jgi:hypothetical protein
MLRPSAIAVVFMSALLWTAPVLPQSTAVKTASQGVVFIHCGPKQPSDPDVQKVAIALLKEGFLVREPEADQDKVGGAGIDYFDDHALATAQKIAQTVNNALGTEKKLMPRLQQTTNPAFYFGVWLYSPNPS